MLLTSKWEDTKILFVLESEEEFDEERVVDFRQDLFLSTDVLDLLLLDDVPLVKDFHCKGRQWRDEMHVLSLPLSLSISLSSLPPSFPLSHHRLAYSQYTPEPRELISIDPSLTNKSYEHALATYVHVCSYMYMHNIIDVQECLELNPRILACRVRSSPIATSLEVVVVALYSSIP